MTKSKVTHRKSTPLKPYGLMMGHTQLNEPTTDSA